MALYGLAHYQRMRTVIDHVQVLPHFDISQPIETCIVDYGCGQGIASLAFMDHLIESGFQIKCLKVILIEPSAHALTNSYAPNVNSKLIKIIDHFFEKIFFIMS